MSQEKRPRGRPPKYPTDEVRERLIESALDSIRSHGLSFGLDAATLEGAIIDADVPRGVSYRMWRAEAGDEAPPQDAFRDAIVVDMLVSARRDWLPDCRAFADEQVANVNAGHSSVQEVLRQLGEFCHQLVADHGDLRLTRALRASAQTQSEVSPSIVAALQQGKDEVLEEYTALFGRLFDAAGISPREGFTTRDVTETIYEAAQAFGRDMGENDISRLIDRPTGPNGENQPWTLAGIAFEAFFQQFFDWVPESLRNTQDEPSA